ADVVAGIEPDGLAEVRGDVLAVAVAQHEPQDERRDQRQHTRDRHTTTEVVGASGLEHRRSACGVEHWRCHGSHPCGLIGPRAGGSRPQMELSNQRPLPRVLLNSRTNGASLSRPLARSSWLRWSIDVNWSSWVSTGSSCLLLSSTRPLSCWDSVCVPVSSLSMA